MNCDQVFDILTRGPFPTGAADDADVEHHLTACHDCRQLAEALRPAVELLHEAIEADECNQLPGYHGSLARAAEPRIETAVMTLVRQESVETTRPGTSSRNNYYSFMSASWLAAAALLGGIFCFAVWSLASKGLMQVASENGGSAGVGALERFQPDENGIKQLVALNLPDACFGAGGNRNPTSDPHSSAVHLCCTQCHATANKQRPPVKSVAVLALSCELCHK